MTFVFSTKPFSMIGVFLAALALGACQSAPDHKTITVTNLLNLGRQAETIVIPVAEIRALVDKFGADSLLVSSSATGQVLVSQVVDNNGDGTPDEILFQADIQAKGELTFEIAGGKGNVARPQSPMTTYSRFVPERTDDYTWENDRVAFRTYGPVAQQMVEQGKPGGTLTSGMDAWLKKVNYPVINSWYKKNQDNAGYYHIDHGEGYDPYHVGASRGLGGLGVWDQDSLYVSRNFTGYKKLTEGPIRTVFELTYAPWQANGRTITEKKRISLDLGSNLSRHEVSLASDKSLPNVAMGITLHDKKGKVKANKAQGWFRYWEPMDDAWLGSGLVIAPGQVQDFKDHRVATQDQSHLLVMARPGGGPLVYYAGFGWTKSGQFKTAAEWDQYLEAFASRVAHPVQVKIN
jgi:hypothetical protein